MRTDKFACTTVAKDVTIAVRMPSGDTVSQITDSEGTAIVRIPETEPYRGGAVVHAPNAVLAEVRYQRPMPAATAVRETVYACAAEHAVGGAVKIELALDGRGRATRVGLDAGDGAFAECVSAGIAKAQFTRRDV